MEIGKGSTLLKLELYIEWDCLAVHVNLQSSCIRNHAIEAWSCFRQTPFILFHVLKTMKNMKILHFEIIRPLQPVSF